MGNNFSHRIPLEILNDNIDNNLYVIAVIFNPCNFNTRNVLYHDFVKRLQKHPNIKLYTTECVFGDQKFTVTNSKNSLHTQIRTNNIWWVKENLINLTVAKLPASSKYIAWLDADIEFTNYNWVNETIRKLSSGYKVLQLFKNAIFLGPNGETGKIEKSFGSHVANYNFENSYPHPGLAWAMRKDAFIEMGGLFDLNPVGSGDLHFAHALIGNIKNTIKNTMSIGYKNSVEYWAYNVSNVVGKTKYQYSKSVGYLDIDIKHYFHGNEKNRQYVERWDILEKYNFDPTTFFVQPRLISGYLTTKLRILRDDISQSLKNEIINYFQNRKEDEKSFEPFKAISVSNGKTVYNNNCNKIPNVKKTNIKINNSPTNADANLIYFIANSQQIYNNDDNTQPPHHHPPDDCPSHHPPDDCPSYHYDISDGYLSHHPSYP